MKYGASTDEKIRDFHRSRRMFCIYEDKLIIADSNLPYSHAEWFKEKGWISEKNDKLMDEIVRGIVDSNYDIYFYKGYDFHIDEETEKVFFSHLDELVKNLGLDLSSRVFGGMIKQEHGKIWPTRKDYGCVGDYIE